MASRSNTPDRTTNNRNEHGVVATVQDRQIIPVNVLEHVPPSPTENRTLATNTILHAEELTVSIGPLIPLHRLDYFSRLPPEIKLMVLDLLSTPDQICLSLVSKRVYALHRAESRCRIFMLSGVHLVNYDRTCLAFSLAYSTLASRLSAWFPAESMLCRRCDRYYAAGAMHTRFECRKVQEKCCQRVIDDSEAEVYNEGNRADRNIYRAIINRRWFRRLANRGLATAVRRIC